MIGMVTVIVDYIEPEESIIASVPTSLCSISRWTASNTAQLLSYGYYFSSLWLPHNGSLYPIYLSILKPFILPSSESLIVGRIGTIWKIN